MEKIKFPDKLVVPVMVKHNITREEAESRLHLLMKSGILPNGHADDPETQEMIDNFLSLDSEECAAKVLFEKTLNECLENKEFVKQYDRLRKRNMTNVINEMNSGDLDKKGERELRKFADFVRDYVFNRLASNPH